MASLVEFCRNPDIGIVRRLAETLEAVVRLAAEFDVPREELFALLS